jgi:hypothetical protein
MTKENQFRIFSTGIISKRSEVTRAYSGLEEKIYVSLTSNVVFKDDINWAVSIK